MMGHRSLTLGRGNGFISDSYQGGSFSSSGVQHTLSLFLQEEERVLKNSENAEKHNSLIKQRKAISDSARKAEARELGGAMEVQCRTRFSGREWPRVTRAAEKSSL